MLVDALIGLGPACWCRSDSGRIRGHSLSSFMVLGAGLKGQDRLLGSIGNKKKQRSLYNISVQSDIYTTQTYILSTDHEL